MRRQGRRTVADLANGLFEHAVVHPGTVALLERLGSVNSHNCRSNECVVPTKEDKPAVAAKQPAPTTSQPAANPTLRLLLLRRPSAATPWRKSRNENAFPTVICTIRHPHSALIACDGTGLFARLTFPLSLAVSPSLTELRHSQASRTAPSRHGQNDPASRGYRTNQQGQHLSAYQ